jgi:hypothetical protein
MKCNAFLNSTGFSPVVPRSSISANRTKGHREEVSAMDLSQRFWRGSGRAGVVDAA